MKVLDLFESRKSVEYTTPNFDFEWNEAKGGEMTKPAWLKYVKTGKPTKLAVSKLSSIDNHMPSKGDWALLDDDKRERAEKAFASGKVELPIVYQLKDGSLCLLGGNTRLNYAKNNGYETCVWLVPPETAVQESKSVHGTLGEELPFEFLRGEYHDSKAFKFKDVQVLKRNQDNWPGPEKNVHVWYELNNGYIVGFNENPNRGWSFPVLRK